MQSEIMHEITQCVPKSISDSLLTGFWLLRSGERGEGRGERGEGRAERGEGRAERGEGVQRNPLNFANKGLSGKTSTFMVNASK